MDWLAGSRLHLVDIVVTRGLTFVPLYVAGFAQGAVFAYVLFVSFQAVLIHANVSWRFGPVRWLLATPQYHHWHHAVEPVDVNFAVHLPVIDAVFGTLYLPDDRWPAAYGLAGPPVPDGYWVQMVFPFRRVRS
jgi:lathosterol oxidase